MKLEYELEYEIEQNEVNVYILDVGRRFLFSTDFSHLDDVEKLINIVNANKEFTQADIDDAWEDGYEEGKYTGYLESEPSTYNEGYDQGYKDAVREAIKEH